jgi:hypothetical protein
MVERSTEYLAAQVLDTLLVGAHARPSCGSVASLIDEHGSAIASSSSYQEREDNPIVGAVRRSRARDAPDA